MARPKGIVGKERNDKGKKHKWNTISKNIQNQRKEAERKKAIGKKQIHTDVDKKARYFPTMKNSKHRIESVGPDNKPSYWGDYDHSRKEDVPSKTYNKYTQDVVPNNYFIKQKRGQYKNLGWSFGNNTDEKLDTRWNVWDYNTKPRTKDLEKATEMLDDLYHNPISVKDFIDKYREKALKKLPVNYVLEWGEQVNIPQIGNLKETNDLLKQAQLNGVYNADYFDLNYNNQFEDKYDDRTLSSFLRVAFYCRDTGEILDSRSSCHFNPNNDNIKLGTNQAIVLSGVSALIHEGGHRIDYLGNGKCASSTYVLKNGKTLTQIINEDTKDVNWDELAQKIIDLGICTPENELGAGVISMISEIHCAMNKQKVDKLGIFTSGHWKRGYYKKGMLETELFAEFCEAKNQKNQKPLEVFKEFFPEIYNGLEECYNTRMNELSSKVKVSHKRPKAGSRTKTRIDRKQKAKKKKREEEKRIKKLWGIE